MRRMFTKTEHKKTNKRDGKSLITARPITQPHVFNRFTLGARSCFCNQRKPVSNKLESGHEYTLSLEIGNFQKRDRVQSKKH